MIVRDQYFTHPLQSQVFFLEALDVQPYQDKVENKEHAENRVVGTLCKPDSSGQREEGQRRQEIKANGIYLFLQEKPGSGQPVVKAFPILFRGYMLPSGSSEVLPPRYL